MAYAPTLQDAGALQSAAAVCLRSWALVPLQGAAVCTLDLGHVAMRTLELACFWAWHGAWAEMCCLGPRLDLARASPRTTISSCCLYACVLLACCSLHACVLLACCSLHACVLLGVAAAACAACAAAAAAAAAASAPSAAAAASAAASAAAASAMPRYNT